MAENNQMTGALNTESTHLLNSFWPNVTNEIRNLKMDHFRTQVLPLARIKKIMKLDEDVKMISAEAPVLFAKACEIFISELSLRAWLHTEDNKRRTLQRNDIAMAITKFDQFDFLIDIVPREDIKPAKRQDEARTSVLPEQIQYYLQLAQQQAQQNQQGATSQASAQPVTQALAQSAAGTTPQLQLAGGAQQVQTNQVGQIQLQGGQILQQPFQVAQQNAPVATSQSQVITIQPPQVQQQQVQQPQQVQQVQVQQPQVFQQVINPSGQIENVPIQLTPQQLQVIQMQLQGKTSNQPIIIQTSASQPTTSQSIVTQGDATQLFAGQGAFQVQQLQGSGQQVFLQQDGEQPDS
ncbi:nuclear transcription factor Y subunit gamma-like isoform X1 [Mya arenaria]|uniref:nuclear transcription factor Y subunit gamma-like isoform X1 n=1 Tax=Mya arenaria TaxID=6604 RepID=UPI0022E65A67|nr:nuclear transcription factor Y subunit gamma-like isoform X1 [Mya arenaria]XP_052775187.1 nuclear transcription factor Y subunit gamma-like isoform X1 [Mya arenaria]XP_052775188.1 nuclear transcription factor Y subunit gamma-like isoform X1 [Mya arenaria]